MAGADSCFLQSTNRYRKGEGKLEEHDCGVNYLFFTSWIIRFFSHTKKNITDHNKTQKLQQKERKEEKNWLLHLFLPYCLKYLKPFFLLRMEAPVLKHALLPLNLLLRSAEKRNGLAETCDCRRIASVLGSKQQPVLTIRWQPCKRKTKAFMFAGWLLKFF